MNQLEQDSLRFVALLSRMYFAERDLDGVLARMTDDVEWIGTGRQDGCRGIREARKMLEMIAVDPENVQTVPVAEKAVSFRPSGVESGRRVAVSVRDRHSVAEPPELSGCQRHRVARIPDIHHLHIRARPVADVEPSVRISRRLRLLGPGQRKVTRVARIGTVQNLHSEDSLKKKHQVSGRRNPRRQFHRVIPMDQARFGRVGKIENPQSVFPRGQIESIARPRKLAAAAESAALPNQNRGIRPRDVIDGKNIVSGKAGGKIVGHAVLRRCHSTGVRHNASVDTEYGETLI